MYAWDEELPDPRSATRLHRVLAPVPEVERAHHAHSLRGRRPDREARSFDAIDRLRVRTQLVVDVMVVTLTEEVQIELR